MKVIASLSTMPDRINLIRPMLNSIVNQVDAIEINVPEICIRTNQTYVIPTWMTTYKKLTIFRTPDHGAITKVAPTLLRYKEDKETYIWSVDDDIAYPPTMLKSLLRNHDPLQKRILAASVANIINGQFQGCRNITSYGMLLEGFKGVLYPPSCIDDSFEDYVEKTSLIPDCKVSDDVVLSNYFFGQGIRVFCSPPVREDKIDIHNCLLSYFKDQYATQLQSGGHHKRYLRVIDHLKKLGMLYWQMDVPVIKSNPTTRKMPPTTRQMPVYTPMLVTPLARTSSINFALSCSSQKSGRRFWG